LEINNNVDGLGLQQTTPSTTTVEKAGRLQEAGEVMSASSDVSTDDVNYATVLLQDIVDAASPETALKFSVEEDLSRMVVAVRAVGSDEIIQQFPPEEFISVAKFIAAQNPDVLSEDFLKGVLFDQRS
jgi:uncharacterized FlaG/YvyC family protein